MLGVSSCKPLNDSFCLFLVFSLHEPSFASYNVSLMLLDIRTLRIFPFEYGKSVNRNDGRLCGSYCDVYRMMEYLHPFLKRKGHNRYRSSFRLKKDADKIKK